MRLVGPGQAALHVQQGAVDGAAEPNREASERVDIAFAGGLSRRRRGKRQLPRMPAQLACASTPHTHDSALVVVADLDAAQEPVHAIVVDASCQGKLVGRSTLPLKNGLTVTFGSDHSFVPQAPPTCTPTYQPVQRNRNGGGAL